MITALAHWPSGLVRLRWVPQPNRYAEPVTAVHCFCFAGEELILVDVTGRGVTIPGGHVETGEGLLDCLQRELAEEACVTVDSPSLLGAVECDHSVNPAFQPNLRYPQLGSQLLYVGIVTQILPFVGLHETSKRIMIPAAECLERYNDWDPVLQAAFENALLWKAA